MITEVIDNGYNLILVQDVDNKFFIPKSFVKLALAGELVILFDTSTSNQTTVGGAIQAYPLKYQDITNPVTASAAALAAAIDAMLPPAVSAGDATAANQVLEIQAINDLKGTAPNLRTLYDIWLQDATSAVYLQRIADGLSSALQGVRTQEGFVSLTAAAADFQAWATGTSVIISPWGPQYIFNGLTYGYTVNFR